LGRLEHAKGEGISTSRGSDKGELAKSWAERRQGEWVCGRREPKLRMAWVRGRCRSTGAESSLAMGSLGNVGVSGTGGECKGVHVYRRETRALVGLDYTR